MDYFDISLFGVRFLLTDDLQVRRRLNLKSQHLGLCRRHKCSLMGQLNTEVRFFLRDGRIGIRGGCQLIGFAWDQILDRVFGDVFDIHHVIIAE